MIQIRCNIEALKKVFTDAEKIQIPYAASRAVNELATIGQARVQADLRRNMIIRREWVADQIKITHFSNKAENPIRARIEVTDKGDFLNKFEAGDTKTPLGGGANIAVPHAARPSPGQLIPANLRPKALELHHWNGRRVIGKQRTFLITMASGKQAIFQRTGPGRDGVRLLYWLTPSVPTPAVLHFVSTFEKTAADMWAPTFERWLNEAMRTAL